MSFIYNNLKTDEICLEVPQCKANPTELLLNLCDTFNLLSKTASLISERMTNVEKEINKAKEIPLIDPKYLKIIKSKIGKKT